MMHNYLTQTAVWHRKIGRNQYGEPVTDSKTIPVRWEGARHLVRDKEGREVVSETRVFCVDHVVVGDYLEHAGRKWPVIAVSVVPGLDGAVSHREVSL
jgi:hypothetical protein